MKLYLLFESAADLSLLKKKKYKDGKETVEDVLALYEDPKTFRKKVKMVAFKPFLNSEVALTTQMEINDGRCPPFLEEFLKANLPTDEKFGLGI